MPTRFEIHDGTHDFPNCLFATLNPCSGGSGAAPQVKDTKSTSFRSQLKHYILKEASPELTGANVTQCCALQPSPARFHGTLCGSRMCVATSNNCSANRGFQEFPLWLSEFRTQHCLCENAGSIPGLTQWVKDPVLPQLECRLQTWLRSGVAMAVAEATTTAAI